MTLKTPHSLLPAGFQDLLPPESDREAYLIQRISDLYKSFGYRFVKPPLMEFEKSFRANELGEALSPQAFRLMDPVSKDMLVLRADITPQIARLAATRMPNSPRPLRLFYAADSLRVQAGQIRTARQFTQIGCECIGLDDSEIDVEIALLAILSLKNLGVTDVTLDIALPDLVPSLLTTIGLKDEEWHDARKLLHQKDLGNLRKYGQKNADLFYRIQSTAGPAAAGIDNLVKLKGLPAGEKRNLERLRHVVSRLEEIFPVFDLEGVSLTVDPLESMGFDYHKAFAFTLFSSQIQGELGRGGRYRARIAEEEDSRSGLKHGSERGFATDSVMGLRKKDVNAHPGRGMAEDTDWSEAEEIAQAGSDKSLVAGLKKGQEKRRGYGIAELGQMALRKFSEGGRQQARKAGEPACGFSLYTDNLRRLIRDEGKPQRLWVPAGTSWADIIGYQQEGWYVIRHISGSADKVTLKKMGCTHRLTGGKIGRL